MDMQFRREFFAAADKCLTSGEVPSLERLCERVAGISPSQAEQLLHQWWQQLPGRVRLQGRAEPHAEMPDGMQQLFNRVWQQAVQEAAAELDRQGQRHDPEADEMQRACDDALKRTRDELIELEQRCREQGVKLDQAAGRQEALEAEVQQLINALTAETAALQKEEQLRTNVEHELSQLRKTYEEAQKVFDQRIKDEQRHNLEALAKSDVETRHFRNALDRLRDESGAREADLGREVNELRASLARAEARVESLSNQARTQEEALRDFQSQDVQQQRDHAQTSAQLLSANNRNKRSEEQLRQLEERVQQLSRKQTELGSEAARREAQLRTQLQQREDEVAKLQVRAQAAEQRAEALDEEIKRLKQRA